MVTTITMANAWYMPSINQPEVLSTSLIYLKGCSLAWPCSTWQGERAGSERGGKPIQGGECTRVQLEKTILNREPDFIGFSGGIFRIVHLWKSYSSLFDFELSIVDMCSKNSGSLWDLFARCQGIFGYIKFSPLPFKKVQNLTKSLSEAPQIQTNGQQCP